MASACPVGSPYKPLYYNFTVLTMPPSGNAHGFPARDSTSSNRRVHRPRRLSVAKRDETPGTECAVNHARDHLLLHRRHRHARVHHDDARLQHDRAKRRASDRRVPALLGLPDHAALLRGSLVVCLDEESHAVSRDVRQSERCGGLQLTVPAEYSWDGQSSITSRIIVRIRYRVRFLYGDRVMAAQPACVYRPLGRRWGEVLLRIVSA